MKKFIPFLVVFAIVFSAVSAFASGLSQAPVPIVLDPALIAVIASVVSFVVTYLLTNLGSLVGLDFSPEIAGATQVILQFVVLFITGLLGKLPSELVPLILTVVMAVLGYFGVFVTQTRHVAMNKQLKLFKYAK